MGFPLCGIINLLERRTDAEDVKTYPSMSTNPRYKEYMLYVTYLPPLPAGIQ